MFIRPSQSSQVPDDHDARGGENPGDLQVIGPIEPERRRFGMLFNSGVLTYLRRLTVLRLVVAGILVSAMVACGGDSTQDGPGTPTEQLSPGPTVSLTPALPQENTGGQPGETPPKASGAQSQAHSSTSPGSETPSSTEPVDAGDAATSFPVPPDRDFFRLAEQLIPGIGRRRQSGAHPVDHA